MGSRAIKDDASVHHPHLCCSSLEMLGVGEVIFLDAHELSIQNIIPGMCGSL